mmetsp:Transcript_35590/g.102705  ORF Transcript_35590/g.102705 Transcript_35590/m.102705 type:complete len:970 (+) Transcript_35590:144-3053(+)
MDGRNIRRPALPWAFRRLAFRRLAIRSVLHFALPALAAIAGLAECVVAACFCAAACWSALEAAILFRAGSFAAFCRPWPFPLRLLGAVLLDTSVWLLLLMLSGNWREVGAQDHELIVVALTPATNLRRGRTSLGSAPALSTAQGGRRHAPALGASEALWDKLNTLSVVLPCANEGDFVWRTVESVFNATPSEHLAEIIVVDDGSKPPIALSPKFLSHNRARILRHEKVQGLIRSKKDGGDAAVGDAVVFLDCHVRPMQNWYGPIISNLRQNPKRIVVPSITALDPDTWKEISPYGGGSKMWMTWNADFEWCMWYAGPYVPIMSGGLLALTRYWWEASGGYDEQMFSWGGENLDQSLRTWLCGGEIMVAEGSRVAHMWRDPSKPKTVLHYAIPTDNVRRNRLRAVEAWLGPWAEKVRTFPEFDDFRPGGRLQVGSLTSMERVKETLECKPFDHFLERFKDLYISTGRLPESTFLLRERTTGLCLQLDTQINGRSSKGHFVLAPCNAREEMQRMHAANRLPSGGCCSGLQVWNWELCMAVYKSGGPVNADTCEIGGDVPAQQFAFREAQLIWQDDESACIAPENLFSLGGLGESDEEVSHMADRMKAVLVLGAGCAAHIEDDASSGGFRVLAAILTDDAGSGSGRKLCLAVPAGQAAEDLLGGELRFEPCEDVSRDRTVFQRRTRLGKSQQIRALHDMCLDAASGSGPIVYWCHSAKELSTNQLFMAPVGGALEWNGSGLGFQGSLCVDQKGADEEAVSFAPCQTASESLSASPSAEAVRVERDAALAEVPKDGQGFERRPIDDGNGDFELRELRPDGAGVARCVSLGIRGRASTLTVAPCDKSKRQRWRLKAAPAGYSSLGAVAMELCVDAASESPSLIQCIPEEGFLSQRFTFHRNGWVEAPRYWADNGRRKLPARCLDSRAPKSKIAVSASCSAIREAHVEWKRLWAEEPLETRLFREVRASRESPAP